MQALAALQRWREQRPNQPAFLLGNRVTTWLTFTNHVADCARGLIHCGLGPGDRIAMLIRPGVEVAALTYACFTVGAIPVFLDPGLGLRQLLHVLQKSGAVALVGGPIVQVIAARYPIPTLRVRICTRTWPGCMSWAHLRRANVSIPALSHDANGPGLILYTSGATGRPKAITISRATLDAQAEALRALGKVQADSILLAILPAMLLIGPALGCTTRIPRKRKHLAHDLAGSTHSFGSPAVWGPLLARLERSGQKLPKLRCLLFGGCPIDPDLLRRWQAWAPEAMLASVYGATEGIPLAWIEAHELLSLSGEGTCLGKTGPFCELAFVPGTEKNGAGMLQARGPVMAKPGWQEMGDIARQDDHGRWWFLGRASEQVDYAGNLWDTVPVERQFLHAQVKKVALVGVGSAPDQIPVLVCEPVRWPWRTSARDALIAATLRAGGKTTIALGLRADRVLFRRSLPVDPRHRAKIVRHQLAVWASPRIARGIARGIAP